MRNDYEDDFEILQGKSTLILNEKDNLIKDLEKEIENIKNDNQKNKEKMIENHVNQVNRLQSQINQLQ